MAHSTYLIQIVRTATNEVVTQFPPGRMDGALGRTEERDFVNAVVANVIRQPVGIFRTTAQVSEAVRQGVIDTLQAAKLAAR